MPNLKPYGLNSIGSSGQPYFSHHQKGGLLGEFPNGFVRGFFAGDIVGTAGGKQVMPSTVCHSGGHGWHSSLPAEGATALLSHS